MSGCFTAGDLPGMCAVVPVPDTRGRLYCTESGFISSARLADDPVGSITVTFSGVHADSEIRVYLPGQVEAAGIENCATDQALTWSVYAEGNSNNTVRIVIVHMAYKIKEFSYVASAGVKSIPVQQEADKWYSNP